MSLARAITKRVKRTTEEVHLPMRSATTRRAGKDSQDNSVLRHKISLPVQLLSTTNMLSFNAPDISIPTTPPLSSSSSTTEDDFSDHSSRPSYTSTPISSPEPLSHESSPIGPEPNHLSCYFPSPTSSPKVSSRGGSKKTVSEQDVPAIPRRAMSHTKATHTAIARHRSMSSHRSQPSVTDRSPVAIVDHDNSLVQTTSYDDHPFGRELEQVNELAEEFGVRDSVVDEDTRILQQKGLFKFGAEQYMDEISGLFGGVFEDRMAWI